METFSGKLAICAGNSLIPGEFPAQMPVMRSFDVFFDLRLNKRLSKQSWGWWFGTLWRPSWRHCNVVLFYEYASISFSEATHNLPVLTYWGRDKMAAIFRTTFANAFSWMKMFKLRLIWSLFQGSNQGSSSIGSDNGLTPARRQTINWIKDGLLCWRISLGLNELIINGATQCLASVVSLKLRLSFFASLPLPVL